MDSLDTMTKFPVSPRTAQMTDVFMGLTVPLAAIAIFTLVVRLSPHLRRVRDFKIDDLFIFIGFVRNFFFMR